MADILSDMNRHLNNEQNIAIGIIINTNNDIFVAIRPDGKSYAGLFEFPGGKVEADEDIQDALRRELMEEVGIYATKIEDFSVEKSVVSESLCLILHFFLVTAWEGEPFGKEGQTTQWIAANTLIPDMFPPANQDVILKLQSDIIHLNKNNQ
ncbi:8-oxo-dGTP diphosphatase MutT [Thorsellia anophelis]|uniref:8-oxo-dGTP diphosphatase n=1 Tax=Thorsellia anophelis DSM 18579 TaxID=1123402 RepID=A0A1H9YEY3_9GAMM|nr:8-oxo-dGTP diphosphatase MutT [Thorsellia anophelis]SES67575.1 8-oxo-dGTP diphosphatase [Thorsellia anophelis DSM 18579]